MPPSYQPAVVEISTPHNHNISFCCFLIPVSFKLFLLRKLKSVKCPRVPPRYQPAVVEISTLNHAAYLAPHIHNISFCCFFIPVSFKLFRYFEKTIAFVRSEFGTNETLQVEHFFLTLWPVLRHTQSKQAKKWGFFFQLAEVHLHRSYFLQNPYYYDQIVSFIFKINCGLSSGWS